MVVVNAYLDPISSAMWGVMLIGFLLLVTSIVFWPQATTVVDVSALYYFFCVLFLYQPSNIFNVLVQVFQIWFTLFPFPI